MASKARELDSEAERLAHTAAQPPLPRKLNRRRRSARWNWNSKNSDRGTYELDGELRQNQNILDRRRWNWIARKIASRSIGSAARNWMHAPQQIAAQIECRPKNRRRSSRARRRTERGRGELRAETRTLEAHVATLAARAAEHSGRAQQTEAQIAALRRQRMDRGTAATFANRAGAGRGSAGALRRDAGHEAIGRAKIAGGIAASPRARANRGSSL